MSFHVAVFGRLYVCCKKKMCNIWAQTKQIFNLHRHIALKVRGAAKTPKVLIVDSKTSAGEG